MSLTCTACGATNSEGSKFCSQCAERLMTAGDAKRATSKSAKGTSSAAGFGVLGMFVLVGLIIFFVFSIGSSDVRGEIRSQGLPFGSYVMVPKECHSGQHESFFGVWVTPPMVRAEGRQGFRGGLKLVKTHLGTWSVYVESPLECKGLECRIRELERTHCQTFDIDVRNTSTIINDIRVREGHVRLDCKLPEGGTLKASVTFDGCS